MCVCVCAKLGEYPPNPNSLCASVFTFDQTSHGFLNTDPRCLKTFLGCKKTGQVGSAKDGSQHNPNEFWGSFGFPVKSTKKKKGLPTKRHPHLYVGSNKPEVKIIQPIKRLSRGSKLVCEYGWQSA